ncbi:MAG: AzlC family ABC transporter permease [Thaumarchaeota archaeon]|nr:AzlC family ABC transporter permease [Nitrososphaerota archaeon]
MLLGVIPVGATYGVLALAAGLPVLGAIGMSSIVFAGSSQFVGVQLLGASVPSLLILFATLMVNLRHLLYSASLAPYLESLGPRWKVVLSYFLTDEAYAVTIAHYSKQAAPQARHWYLLGAGLTLWSAWQVSTIVGVVLGSVLPRSLPLEFVLTLTFIALLVPMVKGLPSVLASISAGVMALLTVDLPFRLNLVVAVFVAVGVGMTAQRLEQARR